MPRGTWYEVTEDDDAADYIKPVKLKLPTDWEAFEDTNTGRLFYVDHARRSSQWDHPLSAEAGEDSEWITRTGSTMSRASVRTLLPNFEGVEDDERLHELPRPHDLPEEWTQMVTKSGRIFYVNHVTKTTQWNDPRIINSADLRRKTPNPQRNTEEFNTLPPGWDHAYDQDGNLYFIDHNTHTTTYDDPRVPKSETPTLKQFASTATSETVTTSTGDRLVNVKGLVAIVTGANSGLGFETARVLAARGAHVTLACRDAESGQLAALRIVQAHPKAIVNTLHLDLASKRSITSFVDEFTQLKSHLHILVLNAAEYGLPYGTTMGFSYDDPHSTAGLERTFVNNYLGNFYLTNLLVPLLQAGAAQTHYPSRVIAVTCNSYRKLDQLSLSRVPLNEREYSSTEAYSQSKLCNMLFIRELHTRFGKSGISAFSANPAATLPTNLMRRAGVLARFVHNMYCRFSKTIPQGAAAILLAATAPELRGYGGLLIEGCALATPTPAVRDSKTASRLWRLSETLCGVVQDSDA